MGVPQASIIGALRFFPLRVAEGEVRWGFRKPQYGASVLPLRVAEGERTPRFHQAHQKI